MEVWNSELPIVPRSTIRPMGWTLLDSRIKGMASGEVTSVGESVLRPGSGRTSIAHLHSPVSRGKTRPGPTPSPHHHCHLVSPPVMATLLWSNLVLMAADRVSWGQSWIKRTAQNTNRDQVEVRVGEEGTGLGCEIQRTRSPLSRFLCSGPQERVLYPFVHSQ